MLLLDVDAAPAILLKGLNIRIKYIRNLDLVSAWHRSSSHNVRHGVLREDRMVISMLLLLNIDPKLSSIYLMAQTL